MDSGTLAAVLPVFDGGEPVTATYRPDWRATIPCAECGLLLALGFEHTSTLALYQHYVKSHPYKALWEIEQKEKVGWQKVSR